MEKRERVQRWMKGISLAGLAVSVALCVVGWRMGIFNSQEKLQAFVKGFGIWGALVFVVFQAVQVVVPVVPGGVSCLAGVLLFGVWKGFLYNYVGICAGSVMAFLIAKYYGKPVLEVVFGEKRMNQYRKWIGSGKTFTRMFAVAIFLPVAPDDFLCYWAGTTEMPLATFTGIILLGKPFAIALYSMGLSAVFAGLLA